MSGFAEPWIPGFDPATGALVLPLWSVAAIASSLLAACVLILRRAGRDGIIGPLRRVGLLLAGAAAAGLALNAISAGGSAAQRRALDARLLELTTHAVMPGSALACLDATAGELVEASCEKALFASPEATAASVSYVTAQLALLADGKAYERRSGVNYEAALAGLRHAIETDRFGIVAHVLADRDGCRPDRCPTFALLRNARRLSENLTQRKYETYVMRHADEWQQSALSLVAANSPSASPAPPTAPNPPSGKPNGLYFPSSASIPPVSIMSAEPSGPAQTAAPGDATAKPQTPRRPGPPAPPAPTQQARRPANLPPPGQTAPGQAGDP